MTLTPRQAAFCREYLIDLNATAAAKRAGYSVATAKQQASRLLTNVNVAEHISELRQAAAQRNEVTLDEVISMLRKSYDDAKAAKQHGPAVRAAELLGKTLGMFRDRVLVDDMARLTDDQLIDTLAKGDPEREKAARLLLGPGEGFPEADETRH
jgi:Terminase small subunit